MQELTKYDNKLNLLNFKGLSKIENNLFFAILTLLKDKGTQTITLNMYEIMQYTERNLTMVEAINLTHSAVDKIIKTACRFELDERTTRFFTLFEVFDIDNKTLDIKVKITPTFEAMLNGVWKEKQYTIFELAEFSELSSKYSQTIYRLCKQFRLSGEFIMRWADFLERLDIPQSYAVADIDKRILKQVIKDFNEPTVFNPNKPIFKNFKIEKIKGRGRGRPITHIKFSFTPEAGEKNEVQEQLRELREMRQNEIKNAPTLETRPGVFGGRVSYLDGFIGKYCYFKNKFDGGNDSCKIINLENLANGKLRATIKNQESEKIFFMEFETLQHLKNSLKVSD